QNAVVSQQIKETMNTIQDALLDAQDKQKLPDAPALKQSAIPLKVIVQNTVDQVTLKLHEIKSVQKSDMWGEIQQLKFTIENRGVETLSYPTLIIFIWGEDDPVSAQGYVRDKIKLENSIGRGEATTQTIPLSASYSGNMTQIVNFKISLVQGFDWDQKNIVSVYNTTLFK
ncbi:MAG: hypothetical protein Q7K43_00055, partial [Candidatus Woesearchaeota archaeon]|nr:hypothetical protein [Candidatus Woesearchaeota archaeon]